MIGRQWMTGPNRVCCLCHMRATFWPHCTSAILRHREASAEGGLPRRSRRASQLTRLQQPAGDPRRWGEVGCLVLPMPEARARASGPHVATPRRARGPGHGSGLPCPRRRDRRKADHAARTRRPHEARNRLAASGGGSLPRPAGRPTQRSGPSGLRAFPQGPKLDVSDPPAPGKMAGRRGEPSRPPQAAGRRGRSRPAQTAPGGLGAAPKERIPENGARDKPCVSRTIREVSSREDREGRGKWQLRKRRDGGRGPFFLLGRTLARTGVMRETGGRRVGRDGWVLWSEASVRWRRPVPRSRRVNVVRRNGRSSRRSCTVCLSWFVRTTEGVRR